MIAPYQGGGDELSRSAETVLHSELVVASSAAGSAQRADTAAPVTPYKIR